MTPEAEKPQDNRHGEERRGEGVAGQTQSERERKRRNAEQSPLNVGDVIQEKEKSSGARMCYSSDKIHNSCTFLPPPRSGGGCTHAAMFGMKSRI